MRGIEASGAPGEDEGALGAVVEGEQSARSGRSLAETVQVVGVVLEAAVVVTPSHRQRAEAERQPHIVVADGVWWCIHLHQDIRYLENFGGLDVMFSSDLVSSTAAPI